MILKMLYLKYLYLLWSGDSCYETEKQGKVPVENRN